MLKRNAYLIAEDNSLPGFAAWPCVKIGIVTISAILPYRILSADVGALQAKRLWHPRNTSLPTLVPAQITSHKHLALRCIVIKRSEAGVAAGPKSAHYKVIQVPGIVVRKARCVYQMN